MLLRAWLAIDRHNLRIRINPIAGLARYFLCPSRNLQKGLGMHAALVRFLKDESGATAIEYGLIAAGISVAIITVVGALGSKLNTTFELVKNSLQ